MGGRYYIRIGYGPVFWFSYVTSMATCAFEEKKRKEKELG
jgi:hypothetical protein